LPMLPVPMVFKYSKGLTFTTRREDSLYKYTQSN
jgi:hypothetical protein